MLSKSKVKYIQSLGHKKFRDEEGLFIAEGPKIVDELLAVKGMAVTEIYGVKEWIDGYRTGAAVVAVEEVTEAELAKISQLTTPNKVIALIRKPAPQPIDPRQSITLALDTIQDPGNMGTIIRIADWFGIANIVCSTGSADAYNPKVVQATMGSLARVNILYTELASWLGTLEGIRVYGAALEGQPVTGIAPLKEGIVVIGNEAKGISTEVMRYVNVKLTIPRIGEAESLNAAVATGIILSHLK